MVKLENSPQTLAALDLAELSLSPDDRRAYLGLVEEATDWGRMCARSGLKFPVNELPKKPEAFKKAFLAGYKEAMKWSENDYHNYLFAKGEDIFLRMKTLASDGNRPS